MTDIAYFADIVRPYVGGCPEGAIEDAIRKAAIRFCEQSAVVRSTLTAVDVDAGTDEYTFTAASGTQPLIVLSLVYNEMRIYPKTQDELDVIDPGWRTADAGPATWFTGLGPGTIKLNRVPDETITDGLIPTIATRPEIGATTFDSLLYTSYSDAIRYGAVSILQEVPGKEWSDMKTSIYNAQIFNTYIQRARSAGEKGFQHASTYARMRTW